MDLSDNNWDPPDGTYTVRIAEVTVGTKAKDGLTFAWVKPCFHIVDGDFNDRTFDDFFWIEPDQQEASMPVKNMCRLATCLMGSEVKNPIEAATIIQEGVDTFLQVRVWRNKYKGKEYVNTQYLQTLTTENVEVEPETEVEPTTA